MTRTILVVEDEPALREVICLVLRTRHGPGLMAPDLSTWLQDAVDLQPDVVLLDLVLDDVDAVELIPRLVVSCPQTMVAALTSMPAESDERRALRAGAFVFYEKSMLPQLNDYLDRDLALFHRALAGEDIMAPSAVTRRSSRAGLRVDAAQIPSGPGRPGGRRDPVGA